MNKLKKIWNTPDDADIGYFIEVDLKYPNKKRRKTKNFPFCPENKTSNKNDFSDMRKRKPDNYTQKN